MSTTESSPTARCDRCGAELERGARYCSSCGQEVSSSATALAPTTPEPTYWSDSAPPQPVMPSYSGSYDSGGGVGKLFSATGRISRLEYFLTLVGIWLAVIIVWLMFSVIDIPILTGLVGLAIWVAALVISVCAGIKRLHDFDQSGWLYLLFLVPFASFIMVLVLLFKGSSPGLNKYGYADSGSVMG
jgi:uncharacterized membrane protein YhaH (DUF805 family)